MTQFVFKEHHKIIDVGAVVSEMQFPLFVNIPVSKKGNLCLFWLNDRIQYKYMVLQQTETIPISTMQSLKSYTIQIVGELLC